MTTLPTPNPTQSTNDALLSQSAESVDIIRYPLVTYAPRVVMQAGIFAFGDRLGAFGSNAPPSPDPSPPTAWDGQTPWTVWQRHTPDTPDEHHREIYSSAECDLALERTTPGVVQGSWVVLELPDRTVQPLWVEHAFDRAFVGFSLAARVTGLRARLPGQTTQPVADYPSALAASATGGPYAHMAKFTVRETTVHAVSEPLQRAMVPDPSPVTGREVVLDAVVDALAPGQRLYFRGTSEAGDTVTEFATLATATHTEFRTTITLTAPLQHRYARASLVIQANVVDATHGETVLDEPLGSGDAGLAAQSFTLRRGPLSTRGSATAPDGRAYPLTVTVDGVPWRRVVSPLDASPTDAAYALSTELDGDAVITFGDGVHGARLPTGQENVRARYRVGAGARGNVDAGRLAFFRTQPRGVRAVTNPEPARRRRRRGVSSMRPVGLRRHRRGARRVVDVVRAVISAPFRGA